MKTIRALTPLTPAVFSIPLALASGKKHGNEMIVQGFLADREGSNTTSLTLLLDAREEGDEIPTPLYFITAPVTPGHLAAHRLRRLGTERP